MSGESDRVTVSTYVSAQQRDIWREEADRLGMSQSEYLRSMVQAGRRGFSMDGGSRNPAEPEPPGSNPGGDGLKTALLELLREEGQLGWTDIVEELLGDVEDDVEAALVALQEENRIQHSPRRGTYSLVGEPDVE